MDQHPIPQDVTGFQFKLVGNMTVKQFGYVAAGVIASVILWYAPPQQNAPLWVYLIKMILIPLCGLGGVIIAFVPIEGRPIDVMSGSFAKALFSPNQYVYRKAGRKFTFSEITTSAADAATAAAQAKEPQQKFTLVSHQQRLANTKEEQLQQLLHSASSRPKSKLDEKEMAFFKTISAAMPGPATPAAAHPAPVAHPQPQPQAQNHTSPATPLGSQSANQTEPRPKADQPLADTPEDLAKQESTLTKQLADAKKEEAGGGEEGEGHSAQEVSAAHEKVVTLENQIKKIHEQKEALEHEITKLHQQLSTQKQVQNPAPQPPPAQQPATPAAPTPAVAPATPPPASHVRSIPEAQGKNVGLLHVSDTPNVVVGIVKDARGNVLSNILVEIKGADGNPVRAFKTNVLGQFASATPLANGTYTIELEDPKKQHSFDVIQISPNGQIMLPIEIISHDAREELRKQLFT